MWFKILSVFMIQWQILHSKSENLIFLQAYKTVVMLNASKKEKWKVKMKSNLDALPPQWQEYKNSEWLQCLNQKSESMDVNNKLDF